MKQIFALIIAGSFLFVGCGSSPADMETQLIEKRCECAHLEKDKDKEGAKACKDEYKTLNKELEKEAAEMAKDMTVEELKEAGEEAKEAKKAAKQACKDSLKD